MDWSYIAGYGDGEASLLLGIIREPRLHKGNRIGGWQIIPNWTISSYDKLVLLEMEQFLIKRDIKVAKLQLKPQRIGQLNGAFRLSIYGWKNLIKFLNAILKYSIGKKEQYLIFKNRLYPLLITLPKNKRNRKFWTKEKFLEAMGYIDKINSLKCRKRGKLNEKYFRELWHL